MSSNMNELGTRFEVRASTCAIVLARRVRLSTRLLSANRTEMRTRAAMTGYLTGPSRGIIRLVDAEEILTRLAYGRQQEFDRTPPEAWCPSSSVSSRLHGW